MTSPAGCAPIAQSTEVSAMRIKTAQTPLTDFYPYPGDATKQ